MLNDWKFQNFCKSWNSQSIHTYLSAVTTDSKMYDYEQVMYAYILMKDFPKKLRMPRERGVPADRDEIKLRRGVMVTPTAWSGLTALAKKLGYKSRSDLIEAIGREELLISPDKQNKTVQQQDKTTGQDS